MSKIKAPRSITLDYLTAGNHPDAVVSGVLLVVIVLLVVSGLVGLIEPVLSLDLFRPDLAFSNLLRSLGQIAVSVGALIAAGLGLAKHPRFPALYLTVSAGLTLLITLGLSLTLSGTEGQAVFPLVSLPVVLAVPYVVFSRRCRLIFHRRLDFNSIKSLAGGEAGWTVPPRLATQVPVLPLPEPMREAVTPKRPRSRRLAAPVEEKVPRLPARRTDGPPPEPRPALTVPPKPPDNPESAALWAALYGSPQPATDTGEEIPAESEDAAATSAAGRRVGLEALINLRPPGT
ncbi:MAG: hypothetical protein WCF85_05275 [Rhodospirillaceae bacterium]